MTTNASTGTSSRRPLLPVWGNQQDGWVRGIVSDILTNRVESTEADVERYLSVLFAEKKLSSDSYELVQKIEEKPQDDAPLDPLRIDKLTMGDGVNALRSGVEIEFGAGVTVVFGENGSGKSGFVRLLKRAAGARVAEEILPNFREASPGTPSATFVATLGTKSNTLKWANEFGMVPLNRVSVFDARGARLHVDDDLTYVYTPGELTLFPLVQRAIERVRVALDAAITKRSPGTNTLLSSFDRASSIYAAIETLGAATDLDELKTYAQLPDDCQSTIEGLRIEIDALKSKNLQTEVHRAKDRLLLVNDLASAISTASSFDMNTYTVKRQALLQATLQRDSAGAKAFEDMAIQGLLSPEWRAFVEAGDAYRKSHLAVDYPVDHDNCSYCRQPLLADAVALIQKYGDFANNAFRKAVDDAKRDIDDYTIDVLRIDPQGLTERLANEVTTENDLLEPLSAALADIGYLIDGITNSSISEWNHETLTGHSEVLSSEISRLGTLSASLQNSLTQREQALKTKQADLLELESGTLVGKMLPQIEQRISDAKWVARANIVKSNFQGTIRSLTDAAKDASETLLNKDFEQRFAHECKLLRAPTVTLNFPGTRGQVSRRKLVAKYKPAQILSEGEQKALALADFMTEVTSVPSSAPVVFDDPITSMDYRRIHEVCDRIILLSKDRQVIVFTHNIWFAAELLGKATEIDKKRVKYYDIQLDGNDAGVVTPASHPRVDSPNQVLGKINLLIQQASTSGVDPEVKTALVEKGYEYLRNFCELIVENELFKGVVQRYAPNVMMTKLDDISLANLQESIAAIVPMFAKSCRYIASHSQPIETQGIRPTLEELKKDLANVVSAREKHKS